MAPTDNAEKITSKPHSPRTLEIAPAQGAGQIPSEGQVRTILTTLEC